MQQSYLEKLRRELWRYNSRDFLNATMAICVLSAAADDEVAPDEIYSIDHLILEEPALQDFSAKKARQRLKEYLSALKRDPARAQNILSNKVRRMAGNHKMARTLMRVAYLVIVADHAIRPRERQEFERLCGLLDLDPGEVWDELAIRYLVWDEVWGVSLVKAPASETARIVNESLESKWSVFETLDDAKKAAAKMYRRAIEHHKQRGTQREVLELERQLADLPSLTTKELPSVYD
jgi:tellurite resistance protein TerB